MVSCKLEEEELEKNLNTWKPFEDADVERCVLSRDVAGMYIICSICNKYNPTNTTRHKNVLVQLTGRWFSVKKEKLEEKSKVTERGLVITLDENNRNEFLMMAVFKIHGTKWHLSPNNDNSSQPFVKKEVDKYRLTIRQVDVTNGDSGGHIIVSIKDYESLQDGVNIQETYKLVKDISKIKNNLFKVDI